MPYRKPLDIIYPTILNVEHFHNVVIVQRGKSGYNSTGLVNVGLEWAEHTITYHTSSPGLLLRAGAMMFAYTNFHAWADGNKRTALMATKFFLYLNQYEFDITDDSADFALEVAQRWENNPQAQPIDEIKRIVDWLRPRVVLPGSLRVLNRFIVTRTALDEAGWEILLKPWIDRTSQRMASIGFKHPTKVNNHANPSKS